MKKIYCYILLALVSFGLYAEEFSMSQFNKMIDNIGKDSRKLDYHFLKENNNSEVFYRYIKQESRGGWFLGIGASTVGEALWADSWYDVFAALWVLDGSAKQEFEEYRHIVSLLSNKLGKPAESTLTSTSWKWKKMLVSVTLDENEGYVGIKIVSDKKKTWVQTFLGWLLF
ncbi:MAG: hypothetical protein LBQ88_20505 [Treponema sp.]|jgi:hypothetical protein|nr:hypothetical protein [Treponema sp.]